MNDITWHCPIAGLLVWAGSIASSNGFDFQDSQKVERLR